MAKKIIAMPNIEAPSNPDETLKKTYDNMFADSKQKILQQNFLKSMNDKKYEDMRGLALIIDLGNLNSKPLQKLMSKLQKEEPNQTYNKPKNFHHTCFVFAFFDKTRDYFNPGIHRKM